MPRTRRRPSPRIPPHGGAILPRSRNRNTRPRGIGERRKCTSGNLAHLVNTVQDLSARRVGQRVVLASDGVQTDTTTGRPSRGVAIERSAAAAPPRRPRDLQPPRHPPLPAPTSSRTHNRPRGATGAPGGASRSWPASTAEARPRRRSGGLIASREGAAKCPRNPDGLLAIPDAISQLRTDRSATPHALSCRRRSSISGRMRWGRFLEFFAGRIRTPAPWPGSGGCSRLCSNSLARVRHHVPPHLAAVEDAANRHLQSLFS